VNKVPLLRIESSTGVRIVEPVKPRSEAPRSSITVRIIVSILLVLFFEIVGWFLNVTLKEREHKKNPNWSKMEVVQNVMAK
jgi:uncharacterized protein YneF (UPF0154 family)